MFSEQHIQTHSCHLDEHEAIAIAKAQDEHEANRRGAHHCPVKWSHYVRAIEWDNNVGL